MPTKKTTSLLRIAEGYGRHWNIMNSILYMIHVLQAHKQSTKRYIQSLYMRNCLQYTVIIMETQTRCMHRGRYVDM